MISTRAPASATAVGNEDEFFYEPTIVECPRQDLTIVDTELFGPVLAVQRFATEEEVLSLANDTAHGLAAGIFTTDSARSVRMAEQINAGIVWINTYRVISPIASFGGMKQSGYGREAGLEPGDGGLHDGENRLA